VWAQIAHDRELRRRQNERAARVQRQVERQLAADASRSRNATEREAKARERERIEGEHLAGLAQADEQNARLVERIGDLSDMLRICVAQSPLAIDDLRAVEIVPFDPGPDGERLPPPRLPVMQDGGVLSWRRRRREFDEAMERYTRDLARHELAERERLTRLDTEAAAHDQIVSDARSAAAARSDRIQLGLREGDPASIEEFAGYA
jgi:hypothetical protein